MKRLLFLFDIYHFRFKGEGALNEYSLALKGLHIMNLFGSNKVCDFSADFPADLNGLHYCF